MDAYHLTSFGAFLGCQDYAWCRGGCRARAWAEHRDWNAADPHCPKKTDPRPG